MSEYKFNFDTSQDCCDDCGDYKDDVKLRPCPYNAGLGGDDKLVLLCDACFDVREYDL